MKTINRYSLVARISVLTCVLGVTRLHAGDYKSGITLGFLGEEGRDYIQECYYHDPLLLDRKVTYIRSGTRLTLGHNARNVARITGKDYSVIGQNGLDGIANSGDEGVIRFKVDCDLNWGRTWSRGGAQNLPSYTTPFSFDDLKYEDGTRVVGNHGPKPGILRNGSTRRSYYHRGILDSFGDEWHGITVADDDDLVTATDTEWRASDGKVHLFVVNPKYPCLSIGVTGDAQFYTTPPKSYFIPKIHEQVTYLSPRSGSAMVTLRTLSGEPVEYRINLGQWLEAGPAVVLGDVKFQTGENTLEYKIKGSELMPKVRKIIKNPRYPSDGEAHGNLLWKDPAGWKKIAGRLSVYPYKNVFENLQKKEDFHGQSEIDSAYRKGLRCNLAGPAGNNAFVVRAKGISEKREGAAKTYAQYAKMALLDNALAIDPVGFEMPHSQTTLPTRELIYRGYYDVNKLYYSVFTYDILIGAYKESHHPDGITPIEDLLVRDYFAAYIVTCMMQMGAFNETEGGGMWEVSRNTGALMAAMAMPSYSTGYFGTSGFNGIEGPACFDAPFPDRSYSWKKVFLDNDAPLEGYPRLAKRFGIDEYIINSDGNFIDKVEYFGFENMGHCLFIAENLVRLYYPEKSFRYLSRAIIRATEGSLMGIKNMGGPDRRSCITVLNSRFPEVAAPTIRWMKTLPSTDSESEGKSFLKAGPFGFAWYESELDSLTPPAAPTGLRKVNR